MWRALATCAVLSALCAGCRAAECAAGFAADTTVNTAGKVASIALDAAASSPSASPSPAPAPAKTDDDDDDNSQPGRPRPRARVK